VPFTPYGPQITMWWPWVKNNYAYRGGGEELSDGLYNGTSRWWINK
jgi:hypothetical protein